MRKKALSILLILTLLVGMFTITPVKSNAASKILVAQVYKSKTSSSQFAQWGVRRISATTIEIWEGVWGGTAQAVIEPGYTYVAELDNVGIVTQTIATGIENQPVGYSYCLNGYSDSCAHYVNLYKIGTDTTPPTNPVPSADKTTPTNTDVTLSAAFSADSTVKQYKIGTGGTWTNYTAPLVIGSNCTVYFKASDAFDNWTGGGKYLIQYQI